MVVSVLIGFIAFFIYYFCTRTLTHWKDKNVVGPKPLPLFGNLLESALRRKHVGIIYQEIYNAYPKEKVIGIYRMTAPTLIIRDLDVVKQILIKDFEAFPDRGIAFSKEKLGDNLFHCDSDTWRVLRKRFSPVFTSKKTKDMFQAIVDDGNQFIDYLEKAALKQNEQELRQHFEKFTMSTIIGAAFGLNVDLYNTDQATIEKAGYYSFRSTYAAESDMLFPNILKKLNMSLYNEHMHTFCREIVRAAMKQKTGNLSGNDAIDMMLRLSQEGKVRALKRHKDEEDVYMEITEDVMAAQVFIMYIAGFGNNALTLPYTLFHLAKHPEVQNKLLQEINYILVKNDGNLTYESVKDMVYLDQVFSETLRLNPLTNSVQRSSARRYNIPGTEAIVEKGTTIIISPYAIHRDERNYPDPDKFDPERFSADNSEGRHPCAFIPFGAGPRSCIGK